MDTTEESQIAFRDEGEEGAEGFWDEDTDTSSDLRVLGNQSNILVLLYK